MNRQNNSTRGHLLLIYLALLAGLVVGWHSFGLPPAQAALTGQTALPACTAPVDAYLINPAPDCDQPARGGALTVSSDPILAAVEQVQLLMMMTGLPHYVYLPAVVR